MVGRIFCTESNNKPRVKRIYGWSKKLKPTCLYETVNSNCSRKWVWINDVLVLYSKVIPVR